MEVAREDVDDLGVLQDQVGRFKSPGDADAPAQRFLAEPAGFGLVDGVPLAGVAE
jgi:hypothetical protein